MVDENLNPSGEEGNSLLKIYPNNRSSLPEETNGPIPTSLESIPRDSSNGTEACGTEVTTTGSIWSTVRQIFSWLYQKSLTGDPWVINVYEPTSYILPGIFCFARLFSHFLDYVQEIGRRKPTPCSLSAQCIRQYTRSLSLLVVDTPEACEKLLDERKHVPYVGFDCEWLNVDTEPFNVSLLQLAFPSGEVILLRVFKFGRVLPRSLCELLSNPRVYKFGVAALNDAKRIAAFFKVDVRGCVDVRHLVVSAGLQGQSPARRKKGGRGNAQSGMNLGALARRILGVNLSKAHDVRCSNWEAPVYTQEQIKYSAMDAVVGLELFYVTVLASHMGDLPKWDLETARSLICVVEYSAPYPSLDGLQAFLFDRVTNQLQEFDPSRHVLSRLSLAGAVSPAVGSLLDRAVDRYFNETQARGQNTGRRNHRPGGPGRPSSTSNRIPLLAKPLYDNCVLLSDNGSVLCTCDQRKARWYLERKLGTQVCDSPLTVKLNFKPNGTSGPGPNYYAVAKDNKCVACGVVSQLVRKNVVPLEYRRQFPLEFKDHQSHDVLLLCSNCHQASYQFDADLKGKLADQYQAPLGTSSTSQLVVDSHLRSVRSAANALLRCGNSLPDDRRQDLEKVVREHLGVSELTEEALTRTGQMSILKPNVEFSGSHGPKVVTQVMQSGQLREFVRMWRQHFLSTMKPLHMPALWSVDHGLGEVGSETMSAPSTEPVSTRVET